MGNSGARLPDPFATLVQYAYNPDNRDEAKLGDYYLWRTSLPRARADGAGRRSPRARPIRRSARRCSRRSRSASKAIDPPVHRGAPAHGSLRDPGECEGLSRSTRPGRHRLGARSQRNVADPGDALGAAAAVHGLNTPVAGLRAGPGGFAGRARLGASSTLLGLLFLTFTIGPPAAERSGARHHGRGGGPGDLRARLPGARPRTGRCGSSSCPYLGGILHGDFGTSLTTGRPVATDLDGGVAGDDRTRDRRDPLGRLPRRSARGHRGGEPRQGRSTISCASWRLPGIRCRSSGSA